MPVRILCSTCNTTMQVADELRGKKVKCKGCGNPVPVVDHVVLAEFAEKKRMPPPPPAPAKRRVVDEEEERPERSSPRRRRKEAAGTNLLPLWIAGGGVALLIIVIVLVLALRTGSDPAQPNQNVVAQNQQAPNAPVNAGPVNAAPAANVQPRANPPKAVVDDPPPGQALQGEQIYQRLLNSTVWIVASHKIVAMNNNQPFQFPGKSKGPKIQIPRPPIPNMPNIPGGPGGPGMPNVPGGPGMPNMPPGMNMLPPGNQQSDLRGSVWDGSETLPGYGKLRFQFISNTQAIMVDARDTLRGTFLHTANNVTLVFPGNVTYNGRINGNNMSGNATNGKDNWTWTLNRTGGTGGGQAPANPIPGGGNVKATGSGSLIDRKYRLVITNVHVVGNSDTVAVHFPEFDDKGELIVHSNSYKQKPGYSGRVVMKEEKADLALVQLDRMPDHAQPLALTPSKAKPAQQVHSVGNPGASKGLWIYSPGKVRQVFQDKWKIMDDLNGRVVEYDAMKLETDSAINPGDSGGPLVDDRCAMVGVAHGGSLVANNISFFIEASEVRNLLEKYYRSVNDRLAQAPAPDPARLTAAPR